MGQVSIVNSAAPDVAVYQQTDFGTLSSGRLLAAEESVAKNLVSAGQELAAGLLTIQHIYDSDMWKEHMIIDTSQPMFVNFWNEYVPWFLEVRGINYRLEHGKDWVRAKLRLYRKLTGMFPDWNAELTMMRTVAMPIQRQYDLEKLVDMTTGELKGQPGSEQAGKQLVEGVVTGEIAPDYLALSNGPGVKFYIEAMYTEDGEFASNWLMAEWSNSDGFEICAIAPLDDVPPVIQAKLVTALRAEKREED